MAEPLTYWTVTIQVRTASNDTIALSTQMYRSDRHPDGVTNADRAALRSIAEQAGRAVANIAAADVVSRR